MSSTTQTTVEENKAIARRFPDEVATERNLDVLDELLSEDFVEHGFAGQEVLGIEDAKAYMERILTAFPDFTATVEDVFGEDDRVAMRVTLSGTQDGEFMGLEATGKTFSAENLVVTRIEDGKIAERWLQTDSLGMLQQLGLIENPFER